MPSRFRNAALRRPLTVALLAASAVLTSHAAAAPHAAEIDLGVDAAAHNMQFSLGWHSPKQMGTLGTNTDQQADFIASAASAFTSMQGMRINELLRTPQEYGTGDPATYNRFWLDRMIDELIIGRGMEARMHVLLYTPPPWMKERQAGTPAGSWEGLRHAMRTFVTNTMQYTNNRVKAATGEDPVIQWDVVNEAVTDSQFASLETLPTGDQAHFFRRLWFRASKFAGPSGPGLAPGPDHLKEALRWARDADGNDVLIINEALGPNRKRDKEDDFYNVIRWIKSDPGTPLDAVGLQFHIDMDEEDPDWDHLDNYLDSLAALGVDIYITELDVKLPLALQGKPIAELGEAFEKQALLYRDLTNLALRHPAVKQINVWGWTDDVTWKYRNEVIFHGRALDFAPKPAAHYIRWAFRNYPEATPRPDHHWKFDDPSDLNNRGFTYKRLAAEPAGKPKPGSPSRAVGSGSLYLDGSSSVRMDGPDVSDQEVEAFSVALWFKAEASTGNRVLLGLGGREHGITLRLSDSNRLQARIIGRTDGKRDDRTVDVPGIQIDRWYHVVVAYDDGDLTLQLDGADHFAEQEAGLPIEQIRFDKPGAVGESFNRNAFNNGKYQYFKGWIDDVRLYTGEALSIEDGKKLHQMQWRD